MTDRRLKKNMRSFLVIAAFTMICMLCACSKADTSPVSDNADQNVGVNDGSSNNSPVSDAQPTVPPTSTPSPTLKPTSTPTPTATPIVTPSIEPISSGYKAFRDSLGRPCISLYAEYKNTSDRSIAIRQITFDFEDNNGRLLATDQMVNCIPQALKPDQIGYMYTYYYDLSGIDLSNGFVPKPDGDVKWADEFYEIEVSDVSFKKGWSDHNVEVIGRGTNNTGKNLTWVEVGAVFYDKNDKVLGFCYGPQDFPDGKTTTFSISGDTMSPEVKVSEIDHVQVFIQGNK